MVAVPLVWSRFSIAGGCSTFLLFPFVGYSQFFPLVWSGSPLGSFSGSRFALGFYWGLRVRIGWFARPCRSCFLQCPARARVRSPNKPFTNLAGLPLTDLSKKEQGSGKRPNLGNLFLFTGQCGRAGALLIQPFKLGMYHT